MKPVRDENTCLRHSYELGLESGVWSMAFNTKLDFHKQETFSQESLVLNLNKTSKNCLCKQRTHNGLENASISYIETLHK